MVLLDLSAAFDTIDHAKLLRALESQCGIIGTALKWFASYLTDRLQAVKIGQAISEFVKLIYGVPQGSVLGPLLFTLYTSPLSAIVRRHGLQYHFYADDSQLYIMFKPNVTTSRDDAIARIEACAADIRAWMSNNYLKLNEDKTELLILTTPQQCHSTSDIRIQIGDDVISPASLPVRNLGFYLTSSLKPECHISKVAAAVNFALYNWGRVENILIRKRARLYYQACRQHVLIIATRYCTGLLTNLSSNCRDFRIGQRVF